MPTTITVNVEPDRIQVKPGDQASSTIMVRNRREEVVHFLLKAEGLPPDWVEVAPDQVSAFPLQSARSQVSIHPPKDARSATYHLTLHVISQENASMEGSALLDIDVQAAVQAAPVSPSVVPEVQPVSVRPQAAAQVEIKAELLKDGKLPPPAVQWRLKLRNASTVLDTFGFSITGIRPNWVKVEPAALTLKPGEEGIATLTVRPSDDTQGATFPFRLQAYSHLNLNQRTELPLQVQVRASSSFRISISPREAESQGRRDFQVSLVSDAASNTDLNLQLSASDQDNACEYIFDQSLVFLPARQTIVSTLRVQPHEPLPPNGRKTYTFAIVATPREGLAPPQRDEARLTQIGAVPLSVVLRPQVKSAELEAEYMLKVMNPASIQATLVFSGDDPMDALKFAFQPSKLALGPRGEGQVQVKVQARAPFERERTQEIPFTVGATREGEMVPAAKTEGKFVQLQAKPLELEIIPSQQSRPGRAQYSVKARNPSTRTVAIWLDAKDEADALAFSFSPAMIRLSAGAEGRSALTAKPKDKLPPQEQRRVHKFAVTGNLDGSKTSITGNGTLAQVRGIDWGEFSAKGLHGAMWISRWVIAVLVLAFMGTAFLQVLTTLSNCNGCNFTSSLEGQPPLCGVLRQVYSIISPSLVSSLLHVSPFTGAAQILVNLLQAIIYAIPGARGLPGQKC